MDKSSNEQMEIFSHPNRLENSSEDNRDFFSDLPDPILVHILSFLPLRDAIRTAVFPRFGKLWLSLPVLDLDNCVYHEDGEDVNFDSCDFEKFMHVVHQVWNHRDENTLDKLRLRFALGQSYSCGIDDHNNNNNNNPNLSDDQRREVEKDMAAIYHVEKLICYAVSRNVKVLDLDFKGCSFFVRYYKLPDVLSTGYLTNLRLAACDIRSCEQINLPALRALFLYRVLLSDEAIERILNGCPFLEDLSVVNCHGFHQLSSKNENLKKLILSVAVNDGLVLVECPHVESIEISGCIDAVTLHHVSSLVEASFYFGGLSRCLPTRYPVVMNLLFMLRQCTTFSICTWSILLMSIWKVNNVLCPRFEWKHVKVKLHLTKFHLPGLSLLLSCCSSLVELTMHTTSQTEGPFWMWKNDSDGEVHLNSQEATLPCLESIMIHSRHIGDPCFIQIVKFLLKNTPRLQKMVISTEKAFTTEQLLELSEELLSLPRASSEAMVCIS
ncbi:Unknown protein [Striga hermonthica]|uniref:FBD domain-containing protein n=1 Tax=Striga hermonthica TaxID=68872 RepID=A0A9N7MSS6_STRHE|nr:Unknown protein [Striga hermonthica]